MSHHRKMPFSQSCRKILVGVAMIPGVAAAALSQDAITGTIEIIRAGTVGKQLHVSDMVEVQNRSPQVVTGERTFDVYLPAQAKISTVLAAGPNNAAVAIAAILTPGEPGHYSVNFPLQPGATKFAFNYDVPYEGRAAFPTRHTYPLQEFAVMIPPTMKFSSTSTQFKTLEAGNRNYEVRAISPLGAGPGPKFEISGSGTLPAIRANAASPSHPPTPVLPNQNSLAAIPAQQIRAPQNPVLPSESTPHSRSRVALWAYGALGILLLAASGVAIRRMRAAKQTPTQQENIKLPSPRHHAPLLEGIKEEMFQLEAAKIRGTISTDEYTHARTSLEEIVKRALQKQAT